MNFIFSIIIASFAAAGAATVSQALTPVEYVVVAPSAATRERPAGTPTALSSGAGTDTASLSGSRQAPLEQRENGRRRECIELAANVRHSDRDVAAKGAVSRLQDFLRERGHLQSESTGYFGPMTLAAVQKFQRENGIEPTGFVGPLTRALLIRATCAPNAADEWARTLPVALPRPVQGDSVIGNAASARPVAKAQFIGDSTVDYAGSWDVFAPGSGTQNGDPADWGWRLHLQLPREMVVSRITVMHRVPGESWSTGQERYLRDGTDLFGKEENPYPLVVFKDGEQLNYEYNTVFGPYAAGTYEFTLYGQREFTVFQGAAVIVEFEGGAAAHAYIPASYSVIPGESVFAAQWSPTSSLMASAEAQEAPATGAVLGVTTVAEPDVTIGVMLEELKQVLIGMMDVLASLDAQQGP
jgi:peptidoglycan hydrolase-like protein with peptidoglycan-binding domain